MSMAATSGPEAGMETSRSTLHDGRVAIDQPVRGYRAGLDAVLLAAALDLRAGAHACEFGCGAGAALLCAARLNPDTRFTAFELDGAMAALAAQNAALNAIQDRCDIHTGDALAMAGRDRFDAVFFNPPFFDDESALRAPSAEKARCLDQRRPAGRLDQGRARCAAGQGPACADSADRPAG